MTVPSSPRSEAYGWLGQFPALREWIDDERQVKNLSAHGFTIENRKFESTVSERRDDFADDRLGLFGPMFEEMGHRARQHPAALLFDMLSQGFTPLCFAGQNFFDTDHPSKDVAGSDVTVSNMADGTEQPWFLMDTSRAIKPIIWQEREDYEFQTVNNHKDDQVFMTDMYKFGIRARVNAGFGLWQLAFASKQELNVDTYAAARQQMMKQRGNEGRVLGVMPSTLIVGPDLEYQAMNIVNAANGDGGRSNPYVGSAALLVPISGDLIEG